jgi:acetyl-CoA C-acetyltransferase
VTAGNSSGLNGAPSAVVLMNRDTAEERALKPMARLVAYSLVGVEPKYMGIALVNAIVQLSAHQNTFAWTSPLKICSACRRL